jgi:xylulokinase
MDVGTTGTKAALFTLDGRIVSAYYEEYEHAISDPTIDAFIGQIFRIIKRSVKGAKVNPAEIRAIGVGTFVGGLVAIDKQGLECFVWPGDQDTGAQTRWIRQRLGNEPVAKLPGRTESQLLWLKQIRPQVYDRAWKFLQFKDYVEYKLTGQIATEWSEASFTMLYDFRDRDWSLRLLNLLSIDRERLPDVGASTSIVGGITKRAAKDTELKEGTPVVAGGIDDATAIIGLDAVRQGIACDLAGTIEDLDINVDKVIPEQHEYLRYGMELVSHVMKDLYIVHLGSFMAADCSDGSEIN